MQRNVKDKSMNGTASTDLQFFYPNPGVTITAKDKDQADARYAEFLAMQNKEEDI